MNNRTVAVMFTVSLLFGNVASLGQTIHVSLRGKPPAQGKPIHWGNGLVALVQDDGQLVTFRPSEAESFRKVSAGFRGRDQMVLRADLMKEFKGFDVSGTGQFMVVHPAGQRDRWAGRFEELYRTMQHYFSTRGFQWTSPQFPFVAIVFPTERQYLSYARSHGAKIGGGTLGYYDPETNRIYMFDVTANRPDTGQWYINAETIIHEAAHQTAFNVGIHKRFAEVPRWVVEGLGTMFEAKGVWDARNHPNRADRVNRAQLSIYRRSVTDERSLDLLKMQIATDEVFRRKPNLAYAHAWALTFYLSEQRPREYARYASVINKRELFADYTAKERIADFQSIFGTDLTMFNAHLQRFVKGL